MYIQKLNVAISQINVAKLLIKPLQCKGFIIFITNCFLWGRVLESNGTKRFWENRQQAEIQDLQVFSVMISSAFEYLYKCVFRY